MIQGLLALLGGPLSDPYEEEFREVWTDIENAFADGGHAVGSGYDGGVSLARAAYTAVRHLKPDSVVETGVARGVTSRVVLEALKQNGVGHLWSIDLPPLAVGWQASSALCVTSDLRENWTLIRGASRRSLPALVGERGCLGLFIHDSLHTYSNMMWEMNEVWPYLERGGLLLSDDVDDNYAFLDFAAKVGESFVIAQEERRSGFIGAIRKS